MAAVVGIDAKVEFSTDDITYNALTERNEFTINISVDVAEHKVFVATLADAWVGKSRTWMNWSGSISGYYDDADDTIFDTVVAGAVIYIRMTNSVANDTQRWAGQCLLTSVDHSAGTDDYATLNVDFEGIGALTREAVA